jgi:hypothetical protein
VRSPDSRSQVPDDRLQATDAAWHLIERSTPRALVAAAPDLCGGGCGLHTACSTMPQLASPFAASGQWYRGNLHCHTTNSDGAMPPDRLVAHYAYAGWDFLAITDHWKLTQFPAGTALPDITLIPSYEVNTAAGSTTAGTNYHIVGLNVQAELPRREGAGPAAAQWYVDAIREQGGEAHLAHPYWSGLSLADVEPLRDLVALEVYNADTEVHIGRGLSQALWDDVLTRRLVMRAVAVDDSHRPGYDSVRSWTVVRAPDRSAESLMGALRAGHFYCSAGPEILDVRWEPEGTRNGVPFGGRVLVRCSPVRSVALVADATRGSRVNAGPFGMALRGSRLRSETNRPEGVLDGELLTGAELLLQGNERYVRVQVEDAQGRCAWTNPLFVRTMDEEG